MCVWRFSPLNGREQVLLGKRKGSHGAGEYSFPGGKIDPGETPQAAAVRETNEEIGCGVSDVEVLPFWSFASYYDLPFDFATLFFRCQLLEDQTPRLIEPAKCEGWDWYNWQSGLPSPLFAGIEALREEIPWFT